MKNNFIELLKELKTTNSNKEKEIILLKYKNDDYTKNLIYYNLNPYYNFYVRKLPKFDTNKFIPDLNFTIKNRYDCFINLLNDLKVRHITGNLAKETIDTVFKLFPENEYEAYRTVLLKSPIGVAATIVNKIWDNLIPTFEVMLAPSELPDVTKIKYPVEVNPKLDGFRAIYIPAKENIFFGRSGLPIENLQLKKSFNALNAVQDYVLDGELYSHELSFDEIASILNSEDKEVPLSLKYVIYDCIPLKDWDFKSCKITYDLRLKKLRELVQSTIGDRTKIIDIISDTIYNSGDVVALYKKYLAEGYEGIMLKDPLGYYKWKRTTIKSGEMLKLKPFSSVDIKITGVYEGEGKYKNMAGGLDTDYNGVALSVSSGLTDLQRKEIWKNINGYIGKTIEVGYFEQTEDGSLRFPTFKRFRPDKD